MFTGLVEETGIVKNIQRGAKSSVLTIQGKIVMEEIHQGDSIAVNGVCLTVISFSDNSFTADVMHETLKRSSLGNLSCGSSVNLERALLSSGRFGGHIVSGHIDGTGVITQIEKDDNAVIYTIKADANIMKYIVEKGSVAVDGISLTVTEVSEDKFSVSVIPHTLKRTILWQKKTGCIVNLENDCIGKYVERLLSLKNGSPKSNITREFLQKYGY